MGFDQNFNKCENRVTKKFDLKMKEYFREL